MYIFLKVKALKISLLMLSLLMYIFLKVKALKIFYFDLQRNLFSIILPKVLQPQPPGEKCKLCSVEYCKLFYVEPKLIKSNLNHTNLNNK